MDIELRGKIDLLTENYNEIRKSLRWDGKLLNHFEALIFSRTDREFSVSKINEIRKFIKQDRRIHSCFKGDFLKLFSVMINDSDDYKEVYDNTVKVYSHLVYAGLTENEKTAFAAFILGKRFKGKELDKKVDRLIEIKKRIGKDDYLSYASLAATNKDIDLIVDEMNIVCDKLNEVGLKLEKEEEGFATALIIEGKDITNKVEKALSIACNIKSELFTVPKKVFSLIGLATLLIEDAETFSKELREVYLMLKGKIGYRYFINNELRLIIALGVLLNKYTEEIQADLIDVNLTDEINVLLALEEYTVFSLALF